MEYITISNIYKCFPGFSRGRVKAVCQLYPHVVMGKEYAYPREQVFEEMWKRNSTNQCEFTQFDIKGNIVLIDTIDLKKIKDPSTLKILRSGYAAYDERKLHEILFDAPGALFLNRNKLDNRRCNVIAIDSSLEFPQRPKTPLTDNR